MAMARRGSSYAMDRVELDLPVDPTSIGTARHLLDDLPKPLTNDALWRAQLVMSELVTNVIKHGESSEQDSVHIWIGISPERLRIEICNSVPPVDRGPIRPPAPGQQGGMGLYLVDRLADRWGVEDPCVWVEVFLAR
jgi:anti-sigma regulatory factor (Ser/Thr protein kinase)